MANRGGEDYLDKALDQAEKFAGKKVTLQHLTCTYTIAPCMLACDSGHPVDSAKYRKQNEKITDKLRSMFEKATGKKGAWLCGMFG
ncbi:hypothetical protein Q7P36_005966 [Cladosporium allicinum]